MADLTMESRQVGDVIVICPQGFINAHTVRQFEQALSQALEDGHEKILINGSELAYIASAGLGVIMGLIEDTRAKGGDIRLAELNDTVRNIFAVLGFNHLCKVLSSEQEGVESYQVGTAG
ncbi:MAG: STAS domain-containing protein [Acidobacteriota bacterium]|nr:MAG: STAS domain-containing protein [Acidobacteriota bacterium]